MSSLPYANRPAVRDSWMSYSIFVGRGGRIPRFETVREGSAYHSLVRKRLDLLDGAGSPLLEGDTVQLFQNHPVSIQLPKQSKDTQLRNRIFVRRSW